MSLVLVCRSVICVLVNMTIVAGVFGSVIGSFLNVVAYRVPLHRSVITPSSACPYCGIRIRVYDNIPVLSWLLLRGKCRTCNSAIPSRYPFVELGTALLFGAVAWKFLPEVVSTAPQVISRGGAILAFAAFLYLAAASMALALIDLDTHTLPNRIVLPSYAVGIALLSAAGLLNGDTRALVRAGIGMAVLWVAYFAMALVYPDGMGLGDVKLAGVLGLFLGYLSWSALITGAFAAFILGGAFSLALLLLRKANRKSGIPFGPWMLTGAWVGVFFGDAISRGYLSLFGLS